MNVRALDIKDRFEEANASASLAVSNPPRRHPLLKAFAQTQYGNLIVKTPEGDTYGFHGKDAGPEAYLHLYSWNALDDLVARGEIGFAEAYMAGQWDTNDLPALLTFGLLNTEALEHYFHGNFWYALWLKLRSLLQRNTLRGSRRNIRAHYDLGNDFYALWLDKSMTYSSALFGDNAKLSLEEAQQAKYRRILDKLEAKPGDHILEIGCGWGGFAEAAARRGLRVTGLTLSVEQKRYAEGRLFRLGLDQLAHIELIDYRKVTGQFDHIVSIEMIEAVGQQYWPTYFQAIKSHLKPGGKVVIQGIMLDDKLFEALQGKYGFIETYIFPGGELPSKSRFRAAAEKAGLACREMFSFGQDYALTLKCWLEKFEAQKDKVKALGYDETFIRMWRFYLASCIASFESKRSDVMQAELMFA